MAMLFYFDGDVVRTESRSCSCGRPGLFDPSCLECRGSGRVVTQVGEHDVRVDADCTQLRLGLALRLDRLTGELRAGVLTPEARHALRRRLKEVTEAPEWEHGLTGDDLTVCRRLLTLLAEAYDHGREVGCEVD